MTDELDTRVGSAAARLAESFEAETEAALRALHEAVVAAPAPVVRLRPRWLSVTAIGAVAATVAAVAYVGIERRHATAPASSPPPPSSVSAASTVPTPTTIAAPTTVAPTTLPPGSSTPTTSPTVTTVAPAETTVTTVSTTEPGTVDPTTPRTITAVDIVASGAADEVCISADRQLAKNAQLSHATALLERTLPDGRWLFCRGDDAGANGALALHSTDGRTWASAAVGVGPFLEGGDAGFPEVVDGSNARVLVTSLVREATQLAITSDAGLTWVVAGLPACTERTPAGQPAPPSALGTQLVAATRECTGIINHGSAFVADPAHGVWVARETTGMLLFSGGLRPIELIDTDGYVLSIAITPSTAWAITVDSAQVRHVVAIDRTDHHLVRDDPLDTQDAPVMVVAAGDDVWVGTGADVFLRHYLADGTKRPDLTLTSPVNAMVATSGAVVVDTVSSDVVHVDATNGSTRRVASLGAPATVAARGNDVWAATTDQLVHIDLASGAITARRAAGVGGLVADAVVDGVAWAAPFEPDPTSRPGIGAGAVARLVPHGVDPAASTSFETLSNNGVSALAASPDGSIYGLNLYTGGLVRIVPGP